jgi:hypothetical protein
MDLSPHSRLLGQRQSIDLQRDLFFGGGPRGEPYALVTSCSDVVAFLKLSETDLVIGLVLIAIVTSRHEIHVVTC